MAQTLSEDLKRTAMKESEVLVSEAEVKAEKVLDAAHRRAAKLAEDIREMRALRGRLAAALRQTIETHLALLETLSASTEEEAEAEKIAYLARPKGESDADERRFEELAKPGRFRYSKPAPRGPRTSPMPIYEYACKGAATSSSASSASATSRVKKCPSCGAQKVRRLISRTSFVLKGGGWYTDLYAQPRRPTKRSRGADSEEAEARRRRDATRRPRPPRRPRREREDATPRAEARAARARRPPRA